MRGPRGDSGERPVDEPLVNRLSAGDSSAFWELWQRHDDELRRLCRLWMRGRAEDADDALSTAMLKTLELLPDQVAEVANVRAWLMRLTHNVCMDFHRQHQRRARLVGDLGGIDAPSAEPPTSAHSPEDALLRREESAWVRRAVQHLPVPLRQPVLLRFFGEMAQRDIAERLKLSSGNVRKRLQYARGILGRRLERFRRPIPRVGARLSRPNVLPG